MGENIIGLAVGGNKVVDVQAAIVQAEKAGVQAAWMTTGGARLLERLVLRGPRPGPGSS